MITCPNCGCPLEEMNASDKQEKPQNLATDPSGSSQTFSANFNNADSETLNCYNAMKLYLED